MTAHQPGLKKRSGVLRADTIDMSHGSGGKAMRDLIEDIIVGTFNNSELACLEDQARFDLSQMTALGDRLALTTDSYVVDPLFFPGGDIGTLAVNGTVNDLAVSGAVPLYLTCSLIIEEGFSVSVLRRVVTSMKVCADIAGVKIVTGDTKVVGRGAADKLFINTAGVGVIARDVQISSTQAKPGDLVIVNGSIGNHGAAIISARNDLALENNITSDCRPLNSLVANMLAAGGTIHCLRDATRGGIATVLNEFAQSSDVSICIDEKSIPIEDQVRGLCEILGFDPLYLANEGTLIAVVPAACADQILVSMRHHKSGLHSAIIGEVRAKPAGSVILKTVFGGERVVDMLVGDQLPRIC